MRREATPDNFGPRTAAGDGWRWEDGAGNGCYVEHIEGKLYCWKEWW